MIKFGKSSVFRDPRKPYHENARNSTNVFVEITNDKKSKVTLYFYL